MLYLTRTCLDGAVRKCGAVPKGPVGTRLGARRRMQKQADVVLSEAAHVDWAILQLD